MAYERQENESTAAWLERLRLVGAPAHELAAVEKILAGEPRQQAGGNAAEITDLAGNVRSLSNAHTTLTQRLFGGSNVQAMKVEYLDRSGSGSLLDLTSDIIKPEYRGVYVGTAGHIFHGHRLNQPCTFTLNGVQMSAKPLMDEEDSEIFLIPIQKVHPTFPTPSTVSGNPIRLGKAIYAVGHTSFGPVTSHGDVMGTTSGKDFQAFLHSAEIEHIEDEEAGDEAKRRMIFDSSLPMSRCLASYNLHQMLGGGGVFGRIDDHWQGIHVLGGAFWGSERALPINAFARTRYSAFVPALHVLKKLLI